MFKPIFVTLTALFLIDASSAGTNPHTIEVSETRVLSVASSHVLLGVAVLGHHVSRIDAGWLVKQPGRGMLHIDWTRAAKWQGLTRTEVSARDVSAAQLEAVVHTIEGLGFPAGAIRAWRVAAPVGYDGFEEGDKVLTIGEILVDLGTLDQARIALDRWWNVIEKNDPFEKIPRTNVGYSGTLYFQPDCAVDAKVSYDTALTQTRRIATMVASAAGTATELSRYEAGYPDVVLCPENRQPQFKSAQGVPPIEIHDFDASELQHLTVTYALMGEPDARAIPPRADTLPPSTTFFEFTLAEPYAATIGAGSVRVQPDAVVVHFKYDLGSKARKDYDVVMRGAQARIAQLQDIVHNPNAILIARSPVDSSMDAFDMYILVRKSDFPILNRLAQAGRTDSPWDTAEYTAFLIDCDAVLRTGLRQAVAISRRKAEFLAALIHAKVRGLGAARVNDYLTRTAVCGFDPRESLSSLASEISFGNATPLRDFHGISFEPTIDAAWILDGISESADPLVRTEYNSQVTGASAIETLESRALKQAAREAVVDDRRIVSVYEAEPLTENRGNGSNLVSETIIALRRP